MRKTYTNNKKWALYFDGERTVITDNPKMYNQFRGVLIPLTPNEAAVALSLTLAKKNEAEALANLPTDEDEDEDIEE